MTFKEEFLMQAVKKLLICFAVLLLSVSVAFGAMTTAQIKQKLEQGMPVQEVLELAIISGATLDQVYAAAETAQVPDGSSVDQIKAEITAAAFIAATPRPLDDSRVIAPLIPSMQIVVAAAIAAQVPMTTIVTQAVSSNVSLTAVMLAAPSPEVKAPACCGSCYRCQ